MIVVAVGAHDLTRIGLLGAAISPPLQHPHRRYVVRLVAPLAHLVNGLRGVHPVGWGAVVLVPLVGERQPVALNAADPRPRVADDQLLGPVVAVADEAVFVDLVELVRLRRAFGKLLVAIAVQRQRRGRHGPHDLSHESDCEPQDARPPNKRPPDPVCHRHPFRDHASKAGAARIRPHSRTFRRSPNRASNRSEGGGWRTPARARRPARPAPWRPARAAGARPGRRCRPARA